MPTFTTPLRLRSLANAGERKVTWLELFFDLVFVAAVSQVAEPLRHHYAAGELARLLPLFLLIWWAWIGHTNFSTRFDSDDGVQRALTLLQMFAVAVMAANAKDALDSRSSAGFAAAYAVVRFVLVAQYARARHIKDARPLTATYVIGHGSAAVIWLASALVPAPERFWVWTLACAVDLGTPWLAVRHSVAAPPDAAHLPERFGLFTLILLGETVVGVMHGMESQEVWTPAAAAAAFLGMATTFVIWWWYFHGASATSEQPVVTRRDAVRFHVWSYAHLPLYIGIIVTGVGVQRAVTAAARADLTTTDAALLTGAVTLVMLAMTIIGAASTRRDRRLATFQHLGVTAVTAASIPAFAVDSPVVLVIALAALCAAQVCVSLAARSATTVRWQHAGSTRPLSSTPIHSSAERRTS